jgi:hypothetical protein
LTNPSLGRMRLIALAASAALCADAARAAPASSEEKEACFRAVDSGQHLRDSRRLVAAKDQFIMCARPVCPGPVKKDCAQWLSEVEATLPTVVLGAKDASGGDVIDVRVSVDGTPLLDKLDGSSIPVDPGPHAFHFEWPGHGSVDLEVLARQGEKNRLVTANFTKATSTAASPVETPAAVSHPTPLGVWVLGGVAVVGGALFTGLAISGQSDVDNLRVTCAPNCSQSSVDSARTKIIVANVALGVGIASLGAATVWFLLSRGSKGETTAVSFQPTPQGPRVGLARSF